MEDKGMLETMVEDVLEKHLTKKSCGKHENFIDELSRGCIGVLVFYGTATGALNCLRSLDDEKTHMFIKADIAFTRMLDNDIVGENLLTLWKDCCSLDTDGAVQVMLDRDIEDIKKHINKGLSYTKEEMSVRDPEKRDGQWWSYYFTKGDNKGAYVNAQGPFYEAKEKVKNKYKGECKVIPFDVMENILCSKDRFIPEPKCIDNID